MAYLVKQQHLVAPVTAPIDADHSLPRVCVIGAGSSGLAAVKNLYTKRIPFDCFEQGTEIGGNWLFDNPNGVSACYDTLEINTSCKRMAFSDFPMPKSYPAYASHDQVHDYFEAYAKHFGFRDQITFNTRVQSVRPDPAGGWLVTVTRLNADSKKQQTHHYDAVIVANGHHWSPRLPEPDYPGQTDGTFQGEQIHAHDYRTGDVLDGKHVVVVGAGNSAMDIAVEASKRAKSVALSIRRGQWVMKKLLAGIPFDQIALPGWMPWWATRLRLRVGAILSGGLQKYGLPRPPHAPGESHPVQSETIRKQLAKGLITVNPGIKRLEEDRVIFTDGTTALADLVVWATGYEVNFPFLEEDIVDIKNNSLPLWHRMILPERPGLFFVGLLQPVGAVMPLAEAQSEWITDLLLGELTLPDKETMRREMHIQDRRFKKRFYASPRHTMEVDFDGFLWDLKKERKRRRS
ncbi:MAG TPA: FAD-dependent oxidoreductase [Microbacteriaceae bacterium]|nr:FAD-dependent oxidoreductase [Microbacteriaceae bacterium]